MSATKVVNALETAVGTECASTNVFVSIDEFDALLSNSTHDHVTDEIVRALGGIDKMLNEYIRITRKYENEELLSGSEMQKIADIISAVPAAPAETIYDKLYEKAGLRDNTFHLSSSDTVWHSIFTEHTADRILAALFSKYTIAIVTTAFIVWFVGGSLIVDPLLRTMTTLTMQSILVVFLVSTILSCNIASLLLILTTFDFWMKVGYSITLAITLCILLTMRRWAWVDQEGVLVTAYITTVINILLIINLALIEGFHGNWKVSFIFGLIVSLSYSFAAILVTFDVFDLEAQELDLWFGFTINLIELLGSCYRVLSLFLWKQTLMAAYTRGEECISIYMSPYIKWTDN